MTKHILKSGLCQKYMAALLENLIRINNTVLCSSCKVQCFIWLVLFFNLFVFLFFFLFSLRQCRGPRTQPQIKWRLWTPEWVIPVPFTLVKHLWNVASVCLSVCLSIIVYPSVFQFDKRSCVSIFILFRYSLWQEEERKAEIMETLIPPWKVSSLNTPQPRTRTSTAQSPPPPQKQTRRVRLCIIYTIYSNEDICCNLI